MTARAGRKQWNAGQAYAGPVEELPIGVDVKEAGVRNERSGANSRRRFYCNVQKQ